MDHDFIVIGSGFGGSVAALRLVEKGYRVLLLEKGKRFRPDDFPKTNWDIRRWMWIPEVGCRGLFRMSIFRHVTVLSGVGVGGGSLVYANTLPVPGDDFFAAASWGQLADWKGELGPHYQTAQRMLGVARNPNTTLPDEVLRGVAEEIGRADRFQLTDVGVFFGEPEKTVPDPFFGGQGPERTGCRQCGACMTGCRHGSKNTLDLNYLYLAERKGLRLEADTEATGIYPLADGGYRVEALFGTLMQRRSRRSYTARRVVLAGGVLGTLDLLLRMKEDPAGLPRLSDRLGEFVRTNSESLIGVISNRRDIDISKGIAISSILHTDDHSHLEPVRYADGSGFFRTMMAPHVAGDSTSERMANLARAVAGDPLQVLRSYFVPNFARYTLILLYMRALEGTLRFRLGKLPGMGTPALMTSISEGAAPTASIPEATDLARRVATRLDGMPASLLTETLFGIPTTAHILGGCCMGDSVHSGVIDSHNEVFGYPGMYVVDGAAVSANPGVNPSLTITALAERAMSNIPAA